MTSGAGLGVLPPERTGVETRTVGIEVATPRRRVARKAVTLGMTGDAALEILAGGLSVIKEEGLLRIMEARAPKPAGRDQPRADMAVGAELGLAVALVAGAFPAVRSGRVGREESGRMVPRRCIGRAGTMALEAGRPSVTGGTGLWPRGSRSCMDSGEIRAMRCRPSPLDLGPFAAAGRRGGNDLHAGG